MHFLRYKAHSTLNNLRPICLSRYDSHSKRHYSSGSGGAAKYVFAITLAGGCTAVGGVIAYAYVDPKFRKCVEKHAPFTTPLFKSAFGDSPAYIGGSDISPSPGRDNTGKSGVLRALPGLQVKPKVEPKADKIEKPKEEVSAKSSSPKEIKKDPVVAVKSPSSNSEKASNPSVVAVVSPVMTSTVAADKKMAVKKAKDSNPYLGPEDGNRKKHELETNVMALIGEAEHKVRDATNAKLETIRAVEYHVQSIREAIEAGPAGDWDVVVAAHAAADKKTQEDMNAEEIGRRQIEKLQKIITQGAQGETTVLHPILAVARETAQKLTKELDEMDEMIQKIDTERVFVRDYGHLVEEGRKRFVQEIRAVMPKAEFASDLKDMKKEQLKTLLLHAHLRVDQLNRKLIEMKMSEDQRVKQAIATRKDVAVKEVVKNSPVVDKQKTDEELKRLQLHFDEELQKKMAENERNYEDKLREVVVTQKKLYDIEHAKDVNFAVEVERAIHAEKIGRALAQLEAIEHSLKQRVVLDAENRRMKQVWLAVHNLVESIKYGKKGSCCMEGRRLPLEPQLKVILKNCADDEFVKTVCSSMNKITKVKGEYTFEDLKTRMAKVFKVGMRVAAMDENGGGVAAHLFSWLKSVFRFTLPLKYSSKDKFDPKHESNEDLLERANYYAKHGHLHEAVKLLQLTRGPTRKLSEDVIVDSRRHEEANLLARLLLAHAAVNSIRSTY